MKRNKNEYLQSTVKYKDFDEMIFRIFCIKSYIFNIKIKSNYATSITSKILNIFEKIGLYSKPGAILYPLIMMLLFGASKFEMFVRNAESFNGVDSFGNLL